jgi:hypothetical protein
MTRAYQTSPEGTGVDGLISRVATGARPKLTAAQMAELRELVIGLCCKPLRGAA